MLSEINQGLPKHRVISDQITLLGLQTVEGEVFVFTMKQLSNEKVNRINVPLADNVANDPLSPCYLKLINVYRSTE